MSKCIGIDKGDLLYAVDGRRKGIFFEVDEYDPDLDSLYGKFKILPDGDSLLDEGRIILFCRDIDDFVDVDMVDDLEINEDSVKNALSYLSDLHGIKSSEGKVAFIERKFDEIKDKFDFDDVHVEKKEFVKGQSRIGDFG